MVKFLVLFMLVSFNIFADCADFGATDITLYDSNSMNPDRKSLAFCEFAGESMPIQSLQMEVQQVKTEAINAFLSTISRDVEIDDGGWVFHPAKAFCRKVKGVSSHLFDAENNEWGICTFADGSVINDWTLYRGTEHARSDLLEKFIASIRQ